MFSRHLKKSLTCAIFIISGCGLKTGEQNKPQQVAEIQSTACLKSSMGQLREFLNGDADDEKLGESFDCLQNVLKSFKDNIRGKEKNSYTAGELASFLQTNILKDKTEFSPALLLEAMKLKVLLVGGNNEVITRAEIDSTSSLVGRLKPEVLRINPHMKLILGKWKFEKETAESKEEKFFQAKNAISLSVARIAQLLASTDREYDINDFLQFVGEVSKMSSGNSSSLEKIVKAKKLIEKFKLNLIGGTSAVKGSEWLSLGSAVSEMLFQSLRFTYFINILNADQADEKLKYYEIVARDLLKLVADLIDAKGKAPLTNIQINELIEAATEVFSDLAISSELIEQVGKLKLVIVGDFGTGHQAWSSADFKTLRDKLPDLMSLVRTAVKSVKHYKINQDGYRKEQINHEDFVQAEIALNAAIEKFTKQILFSYDLIDLKKLVLAVKPLLKNTVAIPENLDELFDFVYATKVTMTGDSGTQLTIKNLQLILNVGVKLLGNYIELSNFVLPFKLNEKAFTENLEPLLLKLRATLALELNLKNSHIITTEELTSMLLMAQRAKILETKIQKTSLDSALNFVWSNVLSRPEDRLNQKNLNGFNEQALEILCAEIALWLDNQKSIFTFFDSSPQFSKQEILALIKLKLDETKSSITKTSLRELLKVIEAPGLMNFNDQNFLRILSPENGNYHLLDLTNSNLSKSIGRIFLRSFSTDLTRINNYVGLTEKEVQDGFDQVKNIFYDLELIDRKSSTFVVGRFTEANLFLSVSNGDDYIDFKEFHHLFLHIMSGVSRGNIFKVMAEKKCMKIQNSVSESRSELDEDCLLNMILEENESFLDLPEFLKLKSELNQDKKLRYAPEENKTYYLSLLKAAGHVQNERKTVFVSDAIMFPHVVQYIETIYARHDTNLNGVLEKNEGLAAFSVFSNLIAFLSKPFSVVKPDDLPGVFIYLLKFHKPPKTLVEKLKFGAFIKDHDCSDGKPCMKEWDIQSNRHDLGAIFNFIADATKPQPVVPPAAPTPVIGGN